MNDSLVLRVHRGTLQVLTEAVDQWRQRAASAEAARDFAEVALACRRLPDDAERIVDAVWQTAAAGSGSRAEALAGEALRELSSTVAVLQSALAVGSEFERNGFSVPHFHRVADALKAVQAVRDDFAANWPWPLTEEEKKEALAQFERGEFQELDDAFAGIAGVTKEVWVQRVEQRKRERARRSS